MFDLCSVVRYVLLAFHLGLRPGLRPVTLCNVKKREVRVGGHGSGCWGNSLVFLSPCSELQRGPLLVRLRLLPLLLRLLPPLLLLVW